MNKRMVLIMGRPGVGKTRLAGTFPSPYFLDLENGAATAHPGKVRRMIISPDADILKNVNKVVTILKGKPQRDGGIVLQDEDEQEFLVQTLVVDSVDIIQQAVADFAIMKGARFKMERADWGILLNMMRPLSLLLMSLPISVVVIAHTKTTEGENNRVGAMDLALQGSLRAQMPAHFDTILHIAERERNQRVVLTQPNIKMNSRWLAKDRHNDLRALADKEGIIKLPANADGYPNNEIANAIMGVSDGG